MDIKIKNKIEKLENISSNYSCVLIDNCAFQECLRYIKKPQDILGKTKYYETQKESFYFWKKNIENFENLYTTLGVFNEIGNHNSEKYKKKIKKRYFHDKHPGVLKLRRVIRDKNKEERGLINYLEFLQRIINLNKEEKMYNRFFDSYSYFKEKYGLSNVDFDFLISGGILSKTRGSSALISNDFNIAKAWRNFLDLEKISKTKFDFFNRLDISVFERLD